MAWVSIINSVVSSTTVSTIDHNDILALLPPLHSELRQPLVIIVRVQSRSLRRFISFDLCQNLFDIGVGGEFILQAISTSYLVRMKRK